MIAKIGLNECRKFLQKQKSGRLGCVLGSGEPYVVPVNYIYLHDFIYIHSLPGLKITAMKANPNVCLQTDESDPEGLGWKSVIAFGEFEEVNEREARKSILGLFYEVFPTFTPVEATSENDGPAKRLIVFRIVVNELTGVKETF